MKTIIENTVRKRWRYWRFPCGLAGVLLLTPSRLQAGAGMDQIRASVERVVTILRDSRLKPDARRAERQTKLRQAIEPNFDFEDMAKRSLGSHWSGRSCQERAKFVTLFTNPLAAAYLDRIESSIGGKFLYLNEMQEGGFSEVATKIIDKNGQAVAINYKLHSANGNWKIYDLLIENVSLVNNYRSQFNRVLNATSFDGLLAKLQEKTGKESGSQTARLNTIVSYSLVSVAFASRHR